LASAAAELPAAFGVAEGESALGLSAAEGAETLMGHGGVARLGREATIGPGLTAIGRQTKILPF
jgi:hypothetical protein